MNKKSRFFLTFSVFLLVFIGILFVYSASMYSAEVNYNNKYHFLIKQIIGAVLGTAGLIFFSKFDYHKLKKFGLIAVVISFVCLILVFIPFIGVENYGAKRWIGFGPITIQASEIAKFGFILFSASYLSKHFESVSSFKTLIPVIAVGGAMCVLILMEPNMSVTICLALTLIVMLFVGGMRVKHMSVLAGLGACAIPVLIFAEPYRIKRLMAFLNPWASPQGEGFQLIQSLYSLGAGGLFGVGLFNSKQKYLFLPFSESDFIFSIIGEETGFVGCVLILVLFLIVIINGIKIAYNCKERFGCYLATGITAIIAIQVFINVAVVTASIPPTGLPLPFISAGSTSLLVFMSAIGVVLNVDKQSRKNKI